jgi:hypothetical protein
MVEVARNFGGTSTALINTTGKAQYTGVYTINAILLYTCHYVFWE